MQSKKYSKEQLSLALNEIQKGMTTSAAAKKFNIPRTTLQDKKFGKHEKLPGAPTILTKEEEKILVKWVIELASQGFPVTKSQLIHSVSILVKDIGRENKFKDGVPGRAWYLAFLKRNPEISVRVSQNLTTGRASITEKSIRDWFSRVLEYFDSFADLKAVLSQPERVYNCDETAFFLCPKDNKVLARKGASHTYSRCANDDKECLTVLIGASAIGKLMPPLTIFPYKRIPLNILQKMPKKWGIGKSESGWMTCESFYEYIANCFYPYLLEDQIELPVILFLDGHSSHISLPLTNFCREKGIILVALLPNATHILQPMDVALFHPLKQIWKREVRNWRIQNNGKKLMREHFTGLVDICIQEAAKPQTIQNGFRKCGLYPFNANEVSYENLLKVGDKPPENPNVNSCEPADKLTHASTSHVDYKNFLSVLEKEIGSGKLDSFRNNNEKKWSGCEKDENLFYLWQSVTTKLNVSTINISDNTTHHSETLNANLFNNLIWDETNVLEFVLESDQNYVASTPAKNKSTPSVKSGIESSSNILQELNPNVLNENKITEILQELSSENKETENKETINTDVVSNQYPTPFKKALFWPETPRSAGKKKFKKRLTPSVATADEFLNYQQRIHNEKILKESKKNNKKTKTKTKTVENEISSINKGDYVVIIYEGEKFPGKVLEVINKSNFKIKTMTFSGKNWRWPEKEDVLIYQKKDVIKKINQPLLINNRGVYAITDFN